MASVKLNHWLIGIFTSIILIFAMSHNAGAVSFNLENYSVSTLSPAPRLNCLVDNSSGTSQNLVNVVSCNNWYNLRNFRILGSYPLKKNDIISFYIILNSADNSGAGTLFNNFASSRYTNLHLLDIQQIGYIDYTKAFIDGSQQGDNFSYFFDGVGLNSLIYKIDLLSLSDHTEADLVFGFQTEFIFSGQNNSALYNMKIVNLVHYVFQGSEENREQAQATQDAVDGSEDAGNSSSSSAQQGGASLLSVITGFFNVITSAQPSNCNFNAPLNTYFGNQRLIVDLCALELPSGIGTLTSIIAIGILIPFAIHMFNKFINLFRSFQS